jgi:crotonobetainyl-CoA:carnitine CoA-transferase CaiB-like acyl-CoA transferase
VIAQHFGSCLCHALALDDLADIDFGERTRRGVELQKAVADAIAGRRRGDLVAALVAAGVPVAPVLDRTTMLAGGPFPAFPIRLPVDPSLPVPALDQHRGEGFGGTT